MPSPQPYVHSRRSRLARHRGRRIGAVWLFLADNDHRNGMFAGRCEAAHIGHGVDDLCSLEGPRVALNRTRPRALLVNGRAVRVRRVWHWPGNWCWTGYLLSARDAARALQKLRAAGFDPDCAPSGFWGAWRGRRPLTPALVQKYGGRQ